MKIKLTESDLAGIEAGEDYDKIIKRRQTITRLGEKLIDLNRHFSGEYEYNETSEYQGLIQICDFGRDKPKRDLMYLKHGKFLIDQVVSILEFLEESKDEN